MRLQSSDECFYLTQETALLRYDRWHAEGFYQENSKVARTYLLVKRKRTILDCVLLSRICFNADKLEDLEMDVLKRWL